MTEIPASVQNITPECRANRGNKGALMEALTRIGLAYGNYVGAPDNSNVTWRVSLVRVEQEPVMTPQDNPQDVGASLRETGSRAAHRANSSVVSTEGFDPARCVLTYALALIAEECAEATQFIGKALRFGFDTPGAPETPFNGDTARTNLPKELGDIRAAIRFAAAHGFVDEGAVQEAEDRKFAKLLNPASRDNLGRQLAPLPASVGRNPEGEDRVDGLRAEHEHAVPSETSADAQPEPSS